ncbi:hypothetical protein BMF94_3498 [Rhodotorula taiwanensis]|uniref:Protein CPL1-like domain-containing protein n=1 Tax=Rhodotorula taiwanensis TaxID=741276 RepID=A0A2S5B9V3_9BASI|nr:hypothetical protein BMF94_3498 [Rhodotorula taiwanensis]
MLAFTAVLVCAPIAALARIHLDVPPSHQLRFDTPDLHRMPASGQPHTAIGRGAPNPSVVVHVVDPSSPSTSFVAAASTASPSHAFTDTISEDDEEVMGDSDWSDSPNFGLKCDYAASGPYGSCGDYLDRESQVDHGLFCSPSGICAGKNAVCGQTEACMPGLICDLAVNRCLEPTAKLLGIETARRASRRRSAAARCPAAADACPSGHGGFECVYTQTDDSECGACRALGGRDCTKIEHALGTSCRKGTCTVHACVEGYGPSADASHCVDALS